MNLRWSTPIRLKDFERAPRENGLFQVGLLRVQMFDPKYIGRAIGAERTIRQRLGILFAGQGVSQITVASRDNLFCRWFVTEDLEGAGGDLLKRYGIGILQQFVWNTKKDGID